jgi:hypothetical protein
MINDLVVESEVDYPSLDVWGNGVLKRVGQGEQTDSRCGQNLGVKACLNVDLHAHTSLDGLNHAGNVFVKKIIHSCDKPSCRVCCRRGWAVREASAIEYRINESAKRFGVAEHIICSVPKSDYGLSFVKMKAKVLAVLRKRGVIGGVLIFHAERFCNFKESVVKGKPCGWYVSFHFHVIGFIDGGYGCCRGCRKNTLECLACSGFEGRTRREFYKESSEYCKKTKVVDDGKSGGWIVSVKGARKTIHGTAWYQLNHATLVRGAKRSTVTWWFGVCGYTKLKLKKEDRVRRDICPICQHVLEEVVYVGNDENSSLFQWWVKEWEEPYLDKDGSPNWIPKPANVRKW